MFQKRVHPAVLLCAFLFGLTFLFSLPGSVPQALATKYAGAFMENGGGARALGMGGAFTAVADDPSATFWNPAGLATTSHGELMVMHSELFGDLIDRDFVAYTQPVDWNLLGGERSGLGISLIRLGVDDIPFTDHLADSLDVDPADGVISDEELLRLFDLQDQIRFKSDQEFALMFSYGEQVGDWHVGATLKGVRQSVGEYSSLGVGADLGFLRPRIWKQLDFGLKLQDITTTYLSWSTGHTEIITPAVVPGLAWRQEFPDWNMGLTLAGSLETRFDNRGTADQFSTGSISANLHLGMEMAFSRKVFLRAGYVGGSDENPDLQTAIESDTWDNITAGAGFRLHPLTVDYAYAGDSLGIDKLTHRISVSYSF